MDTSPAAGGPAATRRRTTWIVAVLAVLAGLGLWLATRGDAPTERPPGATRSAGEAAPRDATSAPTPNPERPIAPAEDAAAAAVAPTEDAGPAAAPPTTGGRVGGRVLDSAGVVQPGVTVLLVGADGRQIDRVESDADGRWALSDAALTGRELVVAGDLEGRGTRRLEPPLVRGEDRTVDLIVGRTRVVAAFVLDPHGDPLAGVPVTLRAMEFQGALGAVSDPSGTVTFPFAPTCALRLEADGGALGADAAWVRAGPRRASVDLVLEPTAELTVLGPAGQPGEVLVRTWDLSAFGEDRSWRVKPDEAASELAQRDRLLVMIDLLYPELRPSGAASLSLQQLTAALEAALVALPPDRRAALEARRTPEAMAELARRQADLVPSTDAMVKVNAERAIVARGAPGQSFRLPASFLYRVSFAAAAGSEESCGAVVLAPGEARTVSCGKGGTTTVWGRLVDARGQPLASAAFELSVDADGLSPGRTAGAAAIPNGLVERGTTDADGRFSVTLQLEGSALGQLQTIVAGAKALARRNIPLVAGATVALRNVVARPDSEALATAPYAGTGGIFDLHDSGVTVRELERDSPLELAGLGIDDTLLLLDGESLAELSLPEVADRLRGSEGTAVELRVRGADGELYDITVERGLVVPTPRGP